MICTTTLSAKAALSEVCGKRKKGVMEIQKSMRRLSTADHFYSGNFLMLKLSLFWHTQAEIWGSGDTKQIEKVHTFAIKRFLNVPLHSSNKMICGETGRYPWFITTYVKCIKYWINLTRSPGTRICRQAFEILLLQHEAGKQNWVSSVQNLLMENGFGIVWLCQGVGSETQFMAEFNDRVISCYKLQMVLFISMHLRSWKVLTVHYKQVAARHAGQV